MASLKTWDLFQKGMRNLRIQIAMGGFQDRWHLLVVPPSRNPCRWCSWARLHDGSFQAAMVQTPKKPKTKKSSNTLDGLSKFELRNKRDSSDIISHIPRIFPRYFIFNLPLEQFLCGSGSGRPLVVRSQKAATLHLDTRNENLRKGYPK